MRSRLTVARTIKAHGCVALVMWNSVAALQAVDFEGAKVEREPIHLVLPGKPTSTTYLGAALSATRNGCHAALVEGSDFDGFAVRLDGKLGPRYDEIATATPVFSEDGSTLAYCARRSNGWRWVVNGVEGPVFPTMTATSFSFSPDGKRHAYVVRPSLKFHNLTRLVVDGIPAAADPANEAQPVDVAPVFSADGTRLAFAENPNRTTLRSMRLNLDGKVGRWYERGFCLIRVPGFGRGMPVKDTGSTGIEFGRLSTPPALRMGFSPDGRHFHYCAESDSGFVVVVDEAEKATHQAIGFDFAFAPGKEPVDYAYLAYDGGRHFLMRTGAKPLLVDALADWSLTYSPDGLHLAFAGIRNGTSGVWVDGLTTPCDVVVSGFGNDGSIRYSPDSKRLAFAIQTRTQVHWVVDGKAGPGTSTTGMSFDFSPDSAHFAYSIVLDDIKAMAVVVDGRIRATHRGVVTGPVFLKDGTLEYLAKDPDGLFRYRVTGY